MPSVFGCAKKSVKIHLKNINMHATRNVLVIFASNPTTNCGGMLQLYLKSNILNVIALLYSILEWRVGV